MRAADPIPRTGPIPPRSLLDAAAEWRPFPLLCNAVVVSSRVLSAILTAERFLHFQLRRDTYAFDCWSKATNPGTVLLWISRSRPKPPCRAACSLSPGHYFWAEMVLMNQKIVRTLCLDIPRRKRAFGKSFRLKVTIIWAPQRTAAARTWRSFG
jgi:hypothetical protein